MTSRTFTLLFLCTLLAAPIAISPQEKKSELYEDKDVYDVYAAALYLPLPHQSSIRNSTLLVIREEVRTWETPRPKYSDRDITLSREAEKDWQPVLEDYLRANEKRRRLVRAFPLHTPYKLVSEAELKFGNWEEFHERFPGAGGYVWFSSVGFNPERTKAIVSVNHRCGGLCGGGGPRFLEKKDGKWVEVRVDASVYMWAS
jgi:hypothetical protein